MWTSRVGVALAAAEPYLTSQRAWLDRLAVVVPAPAATRWLLLADLACLIALGLATRRRALGVSLTLAAGFIVLNLLGMALTDFYLGLTVFHLLVGLVATLTLRATRWLLLADLACLIALGLATRRRALGVSLTLAAGFIVLNLLGMALTDFYLGLTVFHLLVGLVATLTLSRARWLGAVTLGLVLVLGLLT
ncbi:MAG: hypothetical protein DME11_07350 [Candidatus Rokuibacteriota bacterium]|nr:MAG: hypothetical protein DME11_07350 [Candidatus Rokubacteria bacterium]